MVVFEVEIKAGTGHIAILREEEKKSLYCFPVTVKCVFAKEYLLDADAASGRSLFITHAPASECVSVWESKC